MRWGLGRGWIESGFGPYIDTDGKLQRGKTLWDWLDLFIIPIFLVIGAFLLQWLIGKSELERAKDQQRETALREYIATIKELLLDKEHSLRESALEDAVRVVARTVTLATLRELDPVRKGYCLISYMKRS